MLGLMLETGGRAGAGSQKTPGGTLNGTQEGAVE